MVDSVGEIPSRRRDGNIVIILKFYGKIGKKFLVPFFSQRS